MIASPQTSLVAWLSDHNTQTFTRTSPSMRDLRYAFRTLLTTPFVNAAPPWRLGRGGFRRVARAARSR